MSFGPIFCVFWVNERMNSKWKIHYVNMKCAIASLQGKIALM